MYRLALVASHPTQYYAPWYATLAAHSEIDLHVFYLWDFGVRSQVDPKFGQIVKWDVDLLSGYAHSFVPNTAKRPGTSHYGGLDNPKLFDALRAFRPDFVISQGYGWKSLTKLAMSWRDSPLILRGDSHSLGRPKHGVFKTWVRRQFLTRVFRRFAAFACVGKANRAHYRSLGVPDAKLFHVPHCIDNQRFQSIPATAAADWRSEHGIPPDALVYVFAGKFESKKRPELLAKAFNRLDSESAHLVFIGDGRLRPTLEDASRRNPRIHLLPFHNQLQMPGALHAADVLVLPSEGPGETWGLIINEAMACGTPVIVSDHVGCAEDLVIEGETGWVFKAGDEDALTMCIRTAYQCVPENREKFQQATRLQVSHYSYAQATMGLLNLLSSLENRDTSSATT